MCRQGQRGLGHRMLPGQPLVAACTAMPAHTRFLLLHRTGSLPDLFAANQALVFLDVTNNSLSGARRRPWRPAQAAACTQRSPCSPA